MPFSAQDDRRYHPRILKNNFAMTGQNCTPHLLRVLNFTDLLAHLQISSNSQQRLQTEDDRIYHRL